MELRTHAHILKQSRWFIALVTIVVAVGAFLIPFLRPTPYKAVVSFELQFVNRPVTADYQYGAYYDLKAAEIYIQHLMSWFRTPAIVEEVYTTAGVGYEIDSIDRFTNRFQAKQYSAQNFAVIFQDINRDNAEKLAGAIRTVVERRATKESQANETAAFSVEGLDPVIAEDRVNIWFVTLVGLCAGFLFSVLLVYMREYFR